MDVIEPQLHKYMPEIVDSHQVGLHRIESDSQAHNPFKYLAMPQQTIEVFIGLIILLVTLTGRPPACRQSVG